MDVSVFPSYYEPWGYTPLESAAFHVPTITTSLAGFGEWAQRHFGAQQMTQGVVTIDRNDSNFNDVVNAIANHLLTFAHYTPEQIAQARKSAADIAAKADWKHFFKYYRQAYSIALKKSQSRQ